MARIEADLCILGSGSGGLSVAAGASQMGARVVLIEGGKMGGDCLNYGCVPSKALLAASKTPGTPYADAQAHVQAAIAAIAPHDSQERFEGLGVTVIRAYGRFVSPTEVEAGETTVAARRFVIATGSGPFVPPIPGLDGVAYLTNETIWDLTERPEHLVIIGGGPIGIEMAQAHIRLGSRVTVIEAAKALGRDDPDAAALVLSSLRTQGVEILEETQAQEVAQGPDGIRVETSQGTITGSHLLVAVGRKVQVEDLGLDAAGIAYDKRGVTVDASLKSSNRRVYAIGDAAGGRQFTHLAGYHAGIVVRSAVLGLPAKARTDHVPAVTYTDPELAQVGLSEAEARKAHGDALTVVRAEYAGNDRAIAEGKTEGFAKVMIVKGRPVGAVIVGAQAGELISLWGLAIAAKLKMSAISGLVAPYPTLMELNKRAASAYFTPKLFDSPLVKRVVRLVQRLIP